MSKVKVAAFTVSLDGFGAGTGQDIDHPMGIRGEELHPWMVTTKMFHTMIGKEGGTEGVDHDIAERSMENIGAWIMGRNMFGPVRGPWPDNKWRGWWGERPPYHVPVFVLTHYAREPLTMEGGTTFHFITGGIDAALEAAKKAANGKDIRIGGGASTVRQFLQAGYIDELQITFSPIFLGGGENLLSGIDLPALGFNQIQKINGEKAMHIIVTKK
ncbi:MAG: dihydrofolate reductase family protein [Agriterribacter sp.]